LLVPYLVLWCCLHQVAGQPRRFVGWRLGGYVSVILILARQVGLIGSGLMRYFFVMLGVLYANLLLGLAWLDGVRAAGSVILAFIVIFAIAVTRLLWSVGIIPTFPEIALLPL